MDYNIISEMQYMLSKGTNRPKTIEKESKLAITLKSW